MDLNRRQQFFQERFLEILHHYTLDSYRVRIHNAHTIILELKVVLTNWLKGNVKRFETVSLCAEETLQKIKDDQLFLNEGSLKKYFCSILEKIIKEGEKKPLLCLRTVELIDEVNKSISKDPFHIKLFQIIQTITLKKENEEESDMALDKDLNEIDLAISNLATELIFLGFSRQFLYNFVKYSAFKDSNSFEEAIEKIVINLNPEKTKKFSVFFRLTLGKGIKELQLPELLNEFPIELKDIVKIKRAKFIESRLDQRYFKTEVEALDVESAAKLGKENLSIFLDTLHFSLNYYKIIPENTVIVIESTEDGTNAYYTQSLPFMEGIKPNKEELEQLEYIKAGLIFIKNLSNCSKDVVNRLTSALRHLRIGDTDPESEQRFINYWIALEFLFSSPDINENTFSRIKQNLINILLSSYGFRNISYLLEQLRKRQEDITLDDLLDPSKRKLIYESIKDTTLLSYRLRSMEKYLLTNQVSNINKYLHQHERNLKWQIARIYRLRNELIHEAAIKQNIESLTSNLRYYLIFVLKRAIAFFSMGKNSSEENKMREMESFFLKYDFIKDIIEKEASLEIILKYGK